MRVVLVGAGRMGQNHAKALLAAGVPMAGVVDANAAAAHAVATSLGCKAYTELSQVADAQAAILAVPTFLHAALAKQALDAGLHVLVEKPIASTVKEADELVQAAKRRDRVLAVGHVERFNPAARALLAAVRADGGLRVLRSKRLSPRPERIQDVGCILDIGIHDLDLAIALAGQAPSTVRASGGKPIDGAHEDLATITMDFGHGLEAVCEVSWRSPDRVRSWDVTTARGRLHADLFGKSVARLDPEPKLLALEAKDALREEHADFLAAARGTHAPAVDGVAGRQALAVAEAALRSLAAGGTPQRLD